MVHYCCCCGKNDSPPIHLNGGSPFRLRQWGPHGGAEKQNAGHVREEEPELTFAIRQPDVTLRWPITSDQSGRTPREEAHGKKSLVYHVAFRCLPSNCEDMEERLIAAVMTFPELYNPAMREYKDGNRRAVAWRCIALQVPISEEDAKKKWRNLRDRYRKEHMAEKKRRSRSAEEPRRTWKFMPLLHFLDPYVKDRPTSSNMRHGEGASETDSFSASEPSPILSDAEVPSCSTATNPDISLVMRPVTPQENFCELTPQENFCGVTPGPVMPFECPRMPTPGPSQPLQRPCPATPEPLQSPSKPLHEGSRPSRPKRGHTELSEFEAQVMNTLSSRPDEEEHFGLSLAATLRRLPPSKRRLLRCHIEQLVYEVEFGDGLCNRGYALTSLSHRNTPPQSD